MNRPLPDRLETDRLILRPCESRDYPEYAEFMSDAQATRHLAFTPEQRTAAGAKALFEQVLASRATEAPIFVLAVCNGGTDRYIGSCGLSPLEEGVAECFYTILPRYQGRGFATEAARKLLDHAFRNLGLRRIVAHVSDRNPASSRVARKLGMSRTERLEPADRRDAGWRYGVDRSTFLEFMESGAAADERQ